jgi:hypothetical protein
VRESSDLRRVAIKAVEPQLANAETTTRIRRGHPSLPARPITKLAAPTTTAPMPRGDAVTGWRETFDGDGCCYEAIARTS